MLRVRALSLLRASTAPPRRAWLPSAPFSGDSGGGESSAPRLFVVQPRLRPESALLAKLEEAVCLASSLEEQRDGFVGTDIAAVDVPQHIVVQNPSARGHKARADKYFGPGTVETVKIQLNHVESKGEVDAVFVNTILSGIQQRNLERAWGKPVLDRVGLIIEIFNAHANTREGKLQAELAALMYKKTRLVRVRGPDGRYTFGADGEAEVVSARGRGSGGRGFIGGAGETEIHLQRRRISERRRLLLAQIEEVRRTRALQRAARKRHGGSDGRGLATVAIVGYTNAGKSTLVSALSDSPLYSDSRLFATVDPRLRNVVLPSGRKVLLSDTVGFISDLPVQLVEAFRATLEEVVEADLLVHVLDSTAPNLDEHRSAVLEVLEQIGVSKEKLENMIEVWNKIDREDKGVSGEENLDDGEASDISGEDDNYLEPRDENIEAGRSSELSEETVHDAASNVSTRELGDDHPDDNDDHPDDNACKVSTYDLDVDEDDQEHDCSDEWLESEDDQSLRGEENDSSIPLENTKHQQIEISKDLCCSREQSGPDVRTSALTGVGLQELLELIDERLKEQDENFNAKNVVERNAFNKKWRPPREEETEVAV